VKSSNAEYVFEPTEVNPVLARAILRLNKYIVLTMSSELTARIIQVISPQQENVMVGNTGMRLPIITCLEDIHPDLDHSTQACIVRDENLVLLCSDDPAAIMNLGNDIEKELLDEVKSAFVLLSRVVSNMFASIRYLAGQRAFPIRQYLGLGRPDVTLLFPIEAAHSPLPPLPQQILLFLFMAHWTRRMIYI
jgi:hypothetical protein